MDENQPNRLVVFIDKFKIPLLLGLVALVLIIGNLITASYNKSKPANFPKDSIVNIKNVKVDVSGAVLKPGVYELNNDSRIEQAIVIAGGITEDANKEYISKSINLAQKISDGLKIYIPFEGEQSGGVVAGVSSVNIGVKININSATNVELDSLPGVGPVTSSKIVSGRPYLKVEALLDKKIISKAVFEKIKEQITIN